MNTIIILSETYLKKRKFLLTYAKFILANDEYGYPPDLSGSIGRVEYMLKQISLGAEGMSIEEHMSLQAWYKRRCFVTGEN